MILKNKTVLAFGAHPDDVEFGCGGTLLLLKELEHQVVIIDLTRGEKAKRGATERLKEAEEARKIMDVSRKILNFGDKSVSLSEDHKSQVKNLIEEYKPSIVFAPYFIDKHLDHVNTAKLVSQHVPTVHYYISHVKKPNFGVDITKVFNRKIEALDAHETQIKPGDIEWALERNKTSGKLLGVKYGELFFADDKGSVNLPDIFEKI